MKKTKITDCDCFRYDTNRIVSLRLTILGLENVIKKLSKKINEISWYDGFWLLEESEPIYGLAFIAFQNYINSSIYDRFDSLDNQYLKYKLGNKIGDNNRTDIELIISIANYYKHRDHPKDLQKKTRDILTDFNLQYSKNIEINNSPIFKGLEIFSKNWDLKELVKVVEIWRENLWITEE